jgi:hypothetical protein
MHRCLPSSGPAPGEGLGAPSLSDHWTPSTMSKHETTDLFGEYLDGAGRHPLLTKRTRSRCPMPMRLACLA